MINPDFNNILRAALDQAREQAKADGCTGCAFADVEEWEMPCRRCKRNCKDYWRAKAKEGAEQDVSDT